MKRIETDYSSNTPTKRKQVKKLLADRVLTTQGSDDRQSKTMALVEQNVSDNTANSRFNNPPHVWLKDKRNTIEVVHDYRTPLMSLTN